MRCQIQIETCSTEDLPGIEGKLKDQGYRLVNKATEGDLFPHEYIKRSFPISSRWALLWRVK
jgi:hypothetical protein